MALTQPEIAAWLIRLARDLRTAGDVKLVQLSEDGVSDHWLTLAGELEVIAVNVDYDECMRLATTEPA